MELRRGLIRDELELKAYILFVLKYFYEPVPMELLTELTMDRVASYFEFAAALDDLVKNGMVSENDLKQYQITVLGRFTLQSVESGLPYSTRQHTETDIEQVIAKTRRDSSIKTSLVADGDSFKVQMELLADHGTILKLELLASNRKNGDQLISNFRDHAEKIYLSIVDSLTRPNE